MAVIAAITLLGCDRDTAPTVPNVVGPPASLSISPTALSLIVGGSGSITARALDARGRLASGSIVWSTADPTIATVGQHDGQVVAVSPGSTTVTAAAGTLTAIATVSVRPPDPPVAVRISPSALSLIPGGVQRLDAWAIDSTGRLVNTSFEWMSTDAAIATVGGTDGIVTAISAGTTIVTVTAGTLRATATVSVLDFRGSFAFTRLTLSGPGSYTSDVLSNSSSDRTLRSLPRPPEFASIGALAWSSDGTRLAVEVRHSFFGPPDYEWFVHASDLYVLDAAAPAASTWRALTTNGLSTSPTWSPDGKQIAYVEQEELFSTNHVSVIDADGGVPVRLTLDGYYGTPRWSPDGRRLAFSAYAAGSDFSRIFIVNADGSGLTIVTPSGVHDYDPNWSPDGTQLVFVRYRGEPPAAPHFVLAVSDVNGSNVRVVTVPATYAAEPVWSPDGRQILFSSGAGLCVVNVDGSQSTQLTTPPINSWDSAPAWRRER